MNYKATLIISVYNNVPFLKTILDALVLQTEQNFEIIISEDAEHKSMRDFVNSYDFRHDYQHITQPDKGWRKNRALNNAVRHAHSERLIFIDGDSVLHPRFIEMHVRFGRENIILSGKRVKLNPKLSQILLNDPLRAGHMLHRLLPRLISHQGCVMAEEGIFVEPCGLLGLIPRLHKAKRLMGANMSFSRSAIEAINGFDEDFVLPSWGEDCDLKWRFDGLGYKMQSVRNFAVQYHLWHKESWSKDENDVNRKLSAAKAAAKEYVCKNGLRLMNKNSTN